MKCYKCKHITCDCHWENTIGGNTFYNPSDECLGCKNLKEYEYVSPRREKHSFFEPKE